MRRGKYHINAKWKVEWVEFSKNDAQKALARFEQDRPTDESWVEALRREMDLDLWDPFSPAQSPIAFDHNGNRLNGKHRLMALIRSKFNKLTFPVVRNLSPDTFRMFDQAQKDRRQHFALDGYKWSYRDGARVNWAEALITSDLRFRATPREFEHLAFGRWKKALALMNTEVQRQSGPGKAPYIAALMYVHRLDPAFTEKAARAWSSGEGLPKPLHGLRDRSLISKRRQANGGKRSDRIGQTMKMLNALAAWHQGHPVPPVLRTNTTGLGYFSQRLRDGTIERWRKKIVLSEDMEE